MKDQQSVSVTITHVVNPHQFYFKYNNCIRSAFTQFDAELQLYGYELFDRKAYENGYTPTENELVLFYNVIFNKWIRGRVVSVGREILLWCIDNGIWEKSTVKHVLPLPQKFHAEMMVVHLGGLSLLPTEKTLNVHTVEVETHLSQQWDPESIDVFKRIMSTAKTFSFTEEFKLANHKFGLLSIESESGAKKDINNILLAMSKVSPSSQYADEDLSSYVRNDRLESQLYHSIINGSSYSTAKYNDSTIPMKAVSRLSIRSGSELSSGANSAFNEDFDTSASHRSSLDIPTTVEPEGKPFRKSSHFRRHLESMQRDSSETVVSAESEVSQDDLGNTSNNNSSTHKESGSNLEDSECYLRKCRTTALTKIVRQQPLESTMDWINSMNKTSSENDDLQRHQSTQNAPVIAAGKRRNLLELAAKLGTNETVSKSTTSGNKSENPAEKRFGIPAGYAKNCLDTFGGMNRS